MNIRIMPKGTYIEGMLNTIDNIDIWHAYIKS